MCEHCFNAYDFHLPSGTAICRDCFYESYCACCWEPITQVGETNEDSFCATCINNNLPQQRMHHHIVNDNNDNDNNDNQDIDIIYNDNEFNDNQDIDINAMIYNIVNMPMDEDETDVESDELGPPEGFDMNSASVVEHNPEYADNLTNAQVEYEGNWYFALHGQIYSVPYEIEIDDHFVRQDIVSHWDDVRWVGSIFGEYIAWL